MKNEEPSKELQRMLRPSEVAEVIGISRRSFDRLRSRGEVPRPDFEQGKLLRWWPTTILRWLNTEGEMNHGA